VCVKLRENGGRKKGNSFVSALKKTYPLEDAEAITPSKEHYLVLWGEVSPRYRSRISFPSPNPNLKH
jgi:hypothetical protein